jgi:hypothetical protein
MEGVLDGAGRARGVRGGARACSGAVPGPPRGRRPWAHLPSARHHSCASDHASSRLAARIGAFQRGDLVTGGRRRGIRGRCGAYG